MTKKQQKVENTQQGKGLQPTHHAHSLRKKLQTDLEKAGINSNWIDQILGHQLINSRNAYSLPTDEELKEAYTKAYQYIKVYPEISTPTPTQETPKQETPILTEATTTGEENYPVAEARNLVEVKTAFSERLQIRN